jgi:hypothetical protein
MWIGDVNERAQDYLRNPEYEERIVAFCDVLGWRNQIAKAGSDPKKIGVLRRQILLVGRIISNVKPEVDLRFTSFSDNIVLSGPAKEAPLDTLIAMLVLLSDYQQTSAVLGFLTRGGITIGEIYHDQQTVFGPALNRAYELESTVADYPRIVLDKNNFTNSGENKNQLLAVEDCIFLNPFSFRSLKSMDALGPVDPGFWDRVGLPKFRDEQHSIHESLENCLAGVESILRSPLSDKEYRRVAWLYDRLANELGVPLSSSYPRETA